MTVIGQNQGEKKSNIFDEDLKQCNDKLTESVKGNRFLVVGGAGTIGSAVASEIAKRAPAALHIVDISENNLVETVRYLRSSIDIKGELLTFALDVGSREFDAFIDQGAPYDYILNLSALKHVRSEKDPFTLSRLIDVNIFNSVKLAKIASEHKVKKYFCVSTDKAANPANVMGASKRLMELFVINNSKGINVSFARFANVLYSDGSLTYGFTRRFERQQPITAPIDIRRYFINASEAGQLCLLSTVMGENLDIFFPKLERAIDEKTFSELAISFLKERGYEPHSCKSENEARNRATELIKKKLWPCYFFESDTSGEKSFEEFYTDEEKIILDRFHGIGLVKMINEVNIENLINFEKNVKKWRLSSKWNREELIEIFKQALPEFQHHETGKNLDEKM